MSTAPSENAAAGLTISVVICAYTARRWDALGEAIDSVRAQTLPASEVVLVIDHAPELVEAAATSWPDVRVLANRERQGLSGARNTGVGACTCDIVAFLDDDAAAAADWLARLAEAYADPRVVGAGGMVSPRWEQGRPRWFPSEFAWVVGCAHSGMPRRIEPVRNFIGANMSFRRDALVQAGAFSHELGRVGTIPAGCEETELCIRLAALRPDGLLLYDPGAVVDHAVPDTRANVRYFLSRCAAEGRSKAILAGMVGAGSGLAAERTYVRQTLPHGFARGFGALARGDVAGPARSVMIAAGLLTTAAGYLRGRGERRPPVQPVTQRSGETPLRVLMVTPRSPLEHGGVERHVMEVSRRLAKAGVEVEVLCGDPGGRSVGERCHEGVTIRSVRAWPPRRDYYLAPGIWRQMTRETWDVVHIQSYHTLITPLAMLRALTLGIPYVVTFHGGGHSSTLRHRMRGAQRRSMRRLFARASRLVATARFEIQDYGRELHLPPESFVLIPNGSDLAPTRITARAGTTNGTVLASIGRLERYKGHHRVIAALPHVLQARPGARLIIVGTGPYEPTLRRLVAELDIGSHVEFTRISPADRVGMVDLLERISLVVLLSEFETHPMVALEAAAAGRPLLVADRAGLGELAQDGIARAVSPDDPPDAIARAIVEELESPHVAQPPRLTSWDECTDALMALYHEVRRTRFV